MGNIFGCILIVAILICAGVGIATPMVDTIRESARRSNPTGKVQRGYDEVVRKQALQASHPQVVYIVVEPLEVEKVK